MLLVHDTRVACAKPPVALAIGNFDGVHRGHRYLLERVVERARALGGSSVALTFEPHPSRVLAPERASARLVSLDRKIELLAETGLDVTVAQRFDEPFSRLDPRAFVQGVVLALGARAVFVGADFRFGHHRAGDASGLKALGAELGFEVHALDAVEDRGQAISSSRVRAALRQGDLEEASRLLGRLPDLDGLVVHGDHRASGLGFPTANLRTPTEALPGDGVYAVEVQLRGESPRWWPAVANLGVRPTFNAGRSVEVHLLGAPGDLYGRTLRVRFVARLRDEKRFEGPEALRAQLAQDVTRARELLEREGDQ
ncbi:MAG: bifunctional riboflavin kinase/FAD synthetase [Deltaproteobacteria bacterium]|nr:bifunctional riboflavin kinase/FAD synthetase [Deltaproteobacteria bacterium]